MDSDQTIINYGVREQRISFEQLIEQDPSYMLRKWLKLRKGTQSTAIGCALAGTGGVVLGVWTGAIPLMVAGMGVSALSGYMIKHHSEGAKAIQLEANILDQCRPILGLLAQLEQRGANPSDLVSLYDRIIRAAIAQRLDAGEPAQLKEFFQREIQQSNVVSSLLGGQEDRGIASTAVPGQRQPIGNDPQLSAVNVPALPQSSEAAASEDVWWDSSPVATETKSPHPVEHLIGDRLRTSLIVSVSGGGKDILLSNALRSFLSKHPGFKVIVMDCKDDPKETGYYAGLPGVRVHRLNVAIASDGEVVEWVDRCLDEFLKLPERSLLINNEGTLIRAKSMRYVAAVDGLVSSGDSREKYAWEAGHSAHIDDLKINGAARSRFRPLIIGLKGEEMQIQAVLAAKFVADSVRNMTDIRGQLGRSPVNRAWCDGQKWHPMPELENYSGYNRDTRSPMTPTSPTVTKMTTEETRIALEKSFQNPEKFPERDGNPPDGINFSEGSGNRETQWEKDFSSSEDAGKNFPEIDFPLLKAVYLAVKAEMENGKSKSEIVTGLLECKGRKYKAGCVWFDALHQKFEPRG